MKTPEEIRHAALRIESLEADARLARDQMMVAAAGMTMHALRWAVGDESAFEELLNRLERAAYAKRT